MPRLKLRVELEKDEATLKVMQEGTITFTKVDAEFQSLGMAVDQTRILSIEIDERDMITDKRKCRITLEMPLEVLS